MREEEAGNNSQAMLAHDRHDLQLVSEMAVRTSLFEPQTESPLCAS